MTIGVGVVGFGWMGEVHTRGYLRAPHHHDLPHRPVLVAVADPAPGRAAAGAERYGFARATEDWTDVVNDPAVQAVSVTVPNFLHREVGVAVAKAGKHLWIEKPVGLTADDARAIAAAVADAGVRCTVGFNYRHAPAVRVAHNLIAAGELGTVTHVRFRMLADYAADPRGGLSWRFQRARGGNGVLGDLGSHAVDLARYLVGDLAEVVADTSTVIPRRPIPTGAGSHYSTVDGDAPLGDVENEDQLLCLLRFAGSAGGHGARGTLEASRVSVGEECAYGFEVHGTGGALAWDFRRMGELVRDNRTVHMGPSDGSYQPGGGMPMGFDDLKVFEAAGFLRSIVDGSDQETATITDAVRAAEALDAMAESVRTGGWVKL
jgi:predicted dehydrogenase